MFVQRLHNQEFHPFRSGYLIVQIAVPRTRPRSIRIAYFVLMLFEHLWTITFQEFWDRRIAQTGEGCFVDTLV